MNPSEDRDEKIARGMAQEIADQFKSNLSIGDSFALIVMIKSAILSFNEAACKEAYEEGVKAEAKNCHKHCEEARKKEREKVLAKAIRCQTSEDIIVVSDEETAEALCNSRNKCGHPHQIIIGEASFKIIRQAKEKS